MVQNVIVERELSSVECAGRESCVSLGRTSTLPRQCSLSPAETQVLKPGRILLRRKQTLIGTGQQVNSHYLLEWSIGNGKWYSINYCNVAPANFNSESFWAKYRKAMNRVLAGETVQVTAEYDPATKLLTVKEA